MESWRGEVRRVGREARGWFTATWRAGGSPAGDGVIRAEGGSDPVMKDEGAAQDERIARGAAARDQGARGAAVHELNRVSEPGRQRADAPDRQVPGQNRVPSWLQTAAAWSWRLLLLAIVIYLIARLVGILYIVVVPCIVALLLTALLQPLTSRLRRAGLPSMAATWVTLLIAAVVLGLLIALIANRVGADYPTLLAETKHTTWKHRT
jgi:hypothetical protein